MCVVPGDIFATHAGLRGDFHIKEIHELHEMMVKEKKSVVLSNMSSNIFQTICATSGLSPRISAQPPIQSEAKSIDVYSWDDSIEPSQSDRSDPSTLDCRLPCTC